jgi:hypothetical protein
LESNDFLFVSENRGYFRGILTGFLKERFQIFWRYFLGRYLKNLSEVEEDDFPFRGPSGDTSCAVAFALLLLSVVKSKNNRSIPKSCSNATAHPQIDV